MFNIFISICNYALKQYAALIKRTVSRSLRKYCIERNVKRNWKNDEWHEEPQVPHTSFLTCGKF